jgi:crotonobetainyl-CoA:carnitine CoA-transferase CaiB-like acyl-CoA transferase
MPGALEGVVVLEAAQIMAGPFCGLLLADMGADVIKVERPGAGDDTRRMGPAFLGGEAAAFLAINRNKRSVVLNLKSDRGREAFRRLAARADVLIENYRPGTLEGLGLGYADLKGLNPRLIYCSISAFGQTGPYRARGGFDLVAQGMSGLMSVTGMPGGPPVKVGVPITDLNAGMYGAYGILCAYVHRLRTGEGQSVDMSLLEGGIAYTFWESAEYWGTGEVPGPLGSAHRLSAPYQALRTMDGYLNIAAANQATWEALCEALGRPDLAVDPRFKQPTDRRRHFQELADLLEATFRTETTAHWLDLLERAGVPAGPIYDIPRVYRDPHVLARGMLAEVEHPTAGRIPQIGIPVKLSATPGRIVRPAPRLGEHTDEVLAWAGYPPAEVMALRSEGAVG